MLLFKNSTCICVIVFLLLYWFSFWYQDQTPCSWAAPSHSLSPLGHHRPHPNPYRPLPSPLNQGQCLSVSEADSIDFRNHSISFSSSHRLTTKEKKPTLYTHHKRKNRLHLNTTKKKTLYLPPNSSHSAKQSKVPLVSPLPPFSFFSHVHCSRALPLSLSLVQKHMSDGQKIFGRCRKWTRVRKMWGVYRKVVVSSFKKKGEKWEK